MRDLFVVDLDCKRVAVELYAAENIREDLEFFEVTDTADLQDNDWRIFQTELEAEKFLNEYKAALKNLTPLKVFKKQAMPPMLLKRRYMALAALGLKLSTRRSYKKDWKPGTEFYFHDQTYALAVKLVAIKTMEDCYQYIYKLK